MRRFLENLPRIFHLIPSERIISRIYLIRGKRVILDRDLAELYQVNTRDLNKAVARNTERFPVDFMFQLSRIEFSDLMFQFGTSSWGGTRKLPYVFTEYGVAMLSGVLKSKRAVRVNIQIVRTFILLKQTLLDVESLRLKIEDLERKYDKQFRIVFDTIKRLIREDEKPKEEMGFK